jgi:hypothetical protein
MKPINRYRSQPRRLSGGLHYKPKRVIRIRPAPLKIVFRPVNRFGAKPEIIIVS